MPHDLSNPDHHDTPPLVWVGGEDLWRANNNKYVIARNAQGMYDVTGVRSIAPFVSLEEAKNHVEVEHRLSVLP